MSLENYYFLFRGSKDNDTLAGKGLELKIDLWDFVLRIVEGRHHFFFFFLESFPASDIPKNPAT